MLPHTYTAFHLALYLARCTAPAVCLNVVNCNEIFFKSLNYSVLFVFLKAKALLVGMPPLFVIKWEYLHMNLCLFLWWKAVVRFRPEYIWLCSFHEMLTSNLMLSSGLTNFSHLLRAVAKISRCRVYGISRRGIVELGSSFDSIFYLFSMEVTRAHTTPSP